MKLFKMGRKCYSDSKEVWNEYINLDNITAIEGSIKKDKWGDNVRKGYNVFLNGGNKIWITDYEMKQIEEILKNQIINNN